MTLQSHGLGATPRDAVEAKIDELAPWFHNLHLPSGHTTAPHHPLGDFPAVKWRELARALPLDLSGWRALDVGCNAGFYTFELARRGAEVRGIDADERYLRQAEWAADELGLRDRVSFERLQVYELARRTEQFDLVLFLGVLYHLRHPLLALDLLAEKARRLLALQTLTKPDERELPPPPDLPFDEREELLAPGWPADGVHRASLRRRPDELVGARPCVRRGDAPLIGARGRRPAGLPALALPSARGAAAGSRRARRGARPRLRRRRGNDEPFREKSLLKRLSQPWAARSS